MTITDSLELYGQVCVAKDRLERNPKDVEALLKMASLMDEFNEPEPEIKRNYLHRVLAVEPDNQQAREMLRAMGIRPDSSLAPRAAIVAPQIDPFEKTLTFRYAILPRLIVYLFTAIALYFCSLPLRQFDWIAFAFFGVYLALHLIPLWFVTAVVTISNEGIRQSRLFGIARRDVTWDEIEKIEPGFVGGKTIHARDGRRLKITFLMRRYSHLVKALAQRRPDLLREEAPEPFVSRDGIPYEGIKVFRKNQIYKYLLPIMVIFMCLVTTITIFSGQLIAAIISVFVCLIFGNIALYSPHTVTVEGNKLALKSFRKREEYTSGQIRNVEWMTTYSAKRGKSHHILVTKADGNSFSLAGFSGGDRDLYSFLRHWWAGA